MYTVPVLSIKHQTAEIKQWLADRGEVDINTVVNFLDSVKLRQSTTVSSQCDQLY